MGLSLGANLKRLSTWKPIIKKIRTRLGMWKGRVLSMAGRVCLLKSVLSSLSLYYMFIFLMPKGVARLITTIHRRILWASVSTERKVCKAVWHVIIGGKNKGGLGIGLFVGKNKAMLFKRLWRLVNNAERGCQNLITNLYRPTYINGLPLFKNPTPPIWTAISSIINMDTAMSSFLKNSCYFKVGNEETTCFWTYI